MRTAKGCTILHMAIGNRIKEARVQAGLSLRDLAKLVGVQYQSIQKWETGVSQPRRDKVGKIAQALGVTTHWLEYGETDPALSQAETVFPWDTADDLPEGEYTFIPRYRVNVSAGRGQAVFQELQKEQPQSFRTAWLKREGLNPYYLASLYAEGVSMEPTIKDGSPVLVNTQEREVEDGKIYLIRYDDEVAFKRLYKRPGGGLIIHSDNTAQFPQIILSPEEAEHIDVLARARWTASML